MIFQVLSPSRTTGLRSLFAAAVLFAAAAPLSAQFFNCGASCHIISGNVSDGAGGPFLAGHVYLSNSGLTVPAGQTLTIQAGAIIKFSGLLSFNVSGTLIANGTAGSPIIVTSVHDDVGGDHNGNGAGSSLSPGQWVYMSFDGTSSASQVNYLEMRGAGYNGNASLNCVSTTATFNNCTVSNSGGPCVNLNNSASPAMVGCNFVGGSKAAVNVAIGSLAGFSNCTATGQTVYDAPEIGAATVIGTVNITADDTFNGSGVVVAPATITVNNGATLNLGAGVKLKFAGLLAMNVYGTLNTTGSSGDPVVMTSIHDDAQGGDTNRNGAATALAAGQWVYLWLGDTSDASQLTSLRVRGAGYNGNAGIELSSSSATLNDVRTTTIGGPCLNLSNNSYPTVVGCAFDGGTTAVVNARLPALQGFTGCTAAGNSSRNVPVATAPSIVAGESASLTPANTMNGDGVVSVTATVTIDATAALTLAAGMKFKFESLLAANVYGTLTTNGSAGLPVVFTSIHDDAHGGDTNLNLGASVPAAGQWVQLWMGPVSDASSLQHLLVRCAGYNGNAAVELSQSNMTATGLRTQLSGGPCLNLSNNSNPTMSSCAFDGGTTAAVNVAPAAVGGFTGCTATGNAQYDAPTLGATSIVAPQALAFAKSNSFNNDGVFVIPSTFTIDAGSALTLQAGVKLKFAGLLACNTYGTLTTNGTTADPVVLTSVADDAFGGDTNKNGTTTSGAPGQWVQAWFGPSSDTSSLTGLRVRCSGYNGNPSLELSGSDLVMSDVATALSGGPCLDLSNNSYPTISFSAFDGGNYAANRVPLEAFAGFHQCTAAGNTISNAPRTTSATISSGSTAVIRAINTFNGDGVIHLSTTMNVNGTLDVGPGVAFKMENLSSVNLYGALAIRGSGHDPVVFTTIHDDVAGGDTNVNGGASVPSNGNWVQLWIGPAATGFLDHVRVAYSGYNGNNAVECNGAGVSLNAVRVDRSGGRGFYIANSAGTTLDHLVAWNCSGEGIRVVPSRQIRHATVSGSTGAGIFVQNAGSTAINCISWANGGNGFAGFAAGAVSYSCGSGVVGGTGNINSSPLFVDALSGDLGLQSMSPCVDVAEAATSFTMVFDHDEGSRLSDGRLIGLPLPDLGAYERAAYRLKATGKPWSFETFTLQVDGSEPGIAALAFGLGGPAEAMYPYGFLNAGPVSSLAVLAIVPTGTPYVFPMPDVSAYAGGNFVIQALGVPLSNSSLGTFTNIYRGTLDG